DDLEARLFDAQIIDRGQISEHLERGRLVVAEEGADLDQPRRQHRRGLVAVLRVRGDQRVGELVEETLERNLAHDFTTGSSGRRSFETLSWSIMIASSTAS